MPYSKYETVIGLEVHVQLATASKAFCGDSTLFGSAPNTQVSAISLGHPGTLPKVNKQQIEFAVRLGLALGSEIQYKNTFDRKNYFYADLPKGYQITQDQSPICVGGSLRINVKEVEKPIRIHHIHMEEDAGKSLHDLEPKHSLIDLNRAGVPLLEVVTEPDFRSPEEVDTFMSDMRRLVRYLGISDGNMEQGSMRCDCNVSVRLKGEEKLGERCEIKNLNSMRYARRAINYEVKRQIDLIESGGKVRQETLNFDPSTGITAPLRSKEYAHDYRYFPEPDLPPVVLTAALIQGIKDQLPSLPWQLYHQFTQEFSLTDYSASLLIEEKETASFFLNLVQHTKAYQSAANLIINKILPWSQEKQKSLLEFPIQVHLLAAFLRLVEDGKLSNSAAYQQLFPALLAQPDKEPLALAQSLSLIQTDDSSLIEALIDDILAQNQDKVSAYKNGKKGLIGFFMGEIMRNATKKVNPKLTNKLLRSKLEA